jgi:hypothetical protein
MDGKPLHISLDDLCAGHGAGSALHIRRPRVLHLSGRRIVAIIRAGGHTGDANGGV